MFDDKLLAIPTYLSTHNPVERRKSALLRPLACDSESADCPVRLLGYSAHIIPGMDSLLMHCPCDPFLCFRVLLHIRGVVTYRAIVIKSIVFQCRLRVGWRCDARTFLGKKKRPKYQPVLTLAECVGLATTTISVSATMHMVKHNT